MSEWTMLRIHLYYREKRMRERKNEWNGRDRIGDEEEKEESAWELYEYTL